MCVWLAQSVPRRANAAAELGKAGTGSLHTLCLWHPCGWDLRMPSSDIPDLSVNLRSWNLLQKSLWKWGNGQKICPKRRKSGKFTLSCWKQKRFELILLWPLCGCRVHQLEATERQIHIWNKDTILKMYVFICMDIGAFFTKRVISHQKQPLNDCTEYLQLAILKSRSDVHLQSENNYGESHSLTTNKQTNIYVNPLDSSDCDLDQTLP